MKNFPSIVLASKSPRRAEILKNSGLQYRIVAMDVDESYPSHLPILDISKFITQKKSDAYSHFIQENEVLLTADTIVILENEVLEKPANLEEAKSMLQKLSNKKHQVLTSVCLKNSHHSSLFTVSTNVFFREISLPMIFFYIENFQVLDKAGAYGIQEGIGLYAVEKIEGCFYNVMGLPIQRVLEELEVKFI